jgi:hypothetical protein
MWEKLSLRSVPLLPFPPQTLIPRTAPNSLTGRGAEKSLALERKQQAMGLTKCHTYGFVVLTSLIHSRKMLLVVLQKGK